jgi:hypothetical protein
MIFEKDIADDEAMVVVKAVKGRIAAREGKGNTVRRNFVFRWSQRRNEWWCAAAQNAVVEGAPTLSLQQKLRQSKLADAITSVS